MIRCGRVGALAPALAVFWMSEAAAQVACVPIDRIETRGVTLLSAAEVQAALAPFEGGCIGIEGLNGALQALTLAYVEKGYVTARAYLPEQNIADRVLDIAVVEGRLDAIRFNGAPNRRWERIVFPGLIGRPLQLREIEEGLDTIRDMPAYSAEMEISAGQSEGGSVLDVTAEAKRPWTFRVGSNNYGSRADASDPTDRTTLATYSGTLDATLDHVLGLNETFRLGYSRGTETFPFDPEDGDYATDRLEAGFRLPYGPWELQFSHTASSYALTSFGVINFIPSDGWTRETRLSVLRLLGRGRETKTSLGATLETRENEDRVADIVINASSRRLTSLRLDLEHERVFKAGLLTARLGVEQGLTLFGAEHREEVSPTQPEAQFTLIDAGLDYTRPWELETGLLSYSGALRAQYSFDPLHGNYQFNLGGISTVRGTSRGLMSGANGLLFRNELAYTPKEQERWPGTIQLYAALDFGHIFEKFSTTVAEPGGGPPQVIGGAMSGGALGVRGQIGVASIDLSWHQVLVLPDGMNKPDGALLFSLSMRF